MIYFLIWDRVNIIIIIRRISNRDYNMFVIKYYQYDRGGGMEMKFVEIAVFFVFLGSKSKFLLF